jgi:hypothetical protein
LTEVALHDRPAADEDAAEASLREFLPVLAALRHV